MTLEKLLKRYLYISLFAPVALILLYVTEFSGALSPNSSDWANFGSFIGGLLGPFYALLAFIGLIESMRQNQIQKELNSFLESIRLFEKDFNSTLDLMVTCESPWVWGHSLETTAEIKALPLRTLLQSDSIDWQYHLSMLRDGLNFRTQPNGALYQDRDIWLKSKIALDGMFKFLEAYKEKGGDDSIYDYYLNTYEISHNRLIDSQWVSV